ncbi:hypothetical protein BHE74_00029284 [Ensete ventricosum]|nr:hypothetical protein BHE74_00029284 [Ensete ventricosum]
MVVSCHLIPRLIPGPTSAVRSKWARAATSGSRYINVECPTRKKRVTNVCRTKQSKQVGADIVLKEACHNGLRLWELAGRRRGVGCEPLLSSRAIATR